MYRSGPLQLPDWPQISHSIMTPSPTGSPHVSFPPLAFKPIRPSGNSPTGMMMPHPTPIQPQNPIRQQMPFSTFQYPFAFETQQQYGPHQATQQDIWSNAYLPNIFPPMQQTPVRHPTFNTPLWTNPTQPHATEHQNSFQSNVTQTQPKEISTQTNAGITPEQQYEIDRQVASRLQELELAKAKQISKQDSACQYDPRDLGRSETPSQSNHQQREPANVGSTSETSSRQ